MSLRIGSFLAQSPSPAALPASPAASPAVQPPPLPGTFGGLGIGQYLLMFLYLLVCAGLIFAVMSQTTKAEGLTGLMGGATQSVFRGKRSFEEKLSTLTNWLAGAFIVLSIVISFAFRHL
ncbi:MAG TPA: preprotein translocase subunit SecG [Candidatus Nitrosotenuis sp.]|nr:preprotein translocase subunit SecG [Candidatus Nitrosotenuis sp.]